MVPTKRTAVFLILFTGIGVATFLIWAAKPPFYPPGLEVLGAQMVFWGAVSAAASAARTPGRWNEKITREGVRSRKLPRWIWPVFIVVLSVANYLVAISVLLGSLTFTAREPAR
jgi:hypothetical protein